jgi:D-3-phosphoglycerate dehydrogenase
MDNIFISTFPFGEQDETPIKLLNAAGIRYRINPLNRKLTENELMNYVGDATALIAGTETISLNVLKSAKNLKLISRVGVGLDSVDLLSARKRNIKVSYTPDAPAPAVAELTIAFIFNLLRSVHLANNQMHNGIWKRYFGKRISEITFGVIGYGRIGSLVVKKLVALGAKDIYVNDINLIKVNPAPEIIKFVDKEVIFLKSDIVTLHVPLNAQTKNMINLKVIMSMKVGSALINTSRGGIVNEIDLAKALISGHLAGAAIDVFEVEPYHGELSGVENCVLTSHMGSMSEDCRARMEIEATEEVIRYLSSKPLENEVPNEEYSSLSLGGG